MESNTLQEENDYTDLIPCEFCNTLVSFQDYQEHASQCNRDFVFADSFLHRFPQFHQILQQQIHDEQENAHEQIETQNQENEEEFIEETLSQEYDQTDTYIDENTGDEYHIENETTQGDNNEQQPFDGILFQNIENLLQMLHLEENVQHSINQPFQYTFTNPLYDNTTTIIGETDENPNMTINLQQNEQESYEELLNLQNTMGKVKIGLKEETIHSFEKIKASDLDNEYKCIICYEQKDTYVKTPCEHIYCLQCCNDWFKENKKCAFCMTELDV